MLNRQVPMTEEYFENIGLSKNHRFVDPSLGPREIVLVHCLDDMNQIESTKTRSCGEGLSDRVGSRLQEDQQRVVKCQSCLLRYAHLYPSQAK